MNTPHLSRSYLKSIVIAIAAATAVPAAELHVASNGSDSNAGTQAAPFKSISAAADVAQAGDVITVREGIYREQVVPPRGGESAEKRIVYRTAPSEKVVITGSDPVTGWEKVAGDTWKVSLPNKYFGGFNPYSDLIRGDWFNPRGRVHHTGAVYLNGDWLIEAATMDEVLKPAAKRPLWFAEVDNAKSTEYLVNIAWFKVGSGAAIPALPAAANHGTQAAACSEGGQCAGFIRANDWLRHDNVDFGVGAESVELRVAAQAETSLIELRLEDAEGELLGEAKVTATGDWQKWKSVPVKIKPTSGKKNLCLVIKTPRVKTDNTTIWAQFPGVNPNQSNVEINVRKTVFSPDKTGIDFITVRGFKLCNAATNWAPPTAGQIGLVSAYWCKGWIIEDNEITYSKCAGVALGKYSDEFDNTSADTAEGYVKTVERALENGWNKETVGSHLVRNNHIHHCEQTGVVGSLGCAFSTVTGNEIHDIHVLDLFGGAEMGGIKFHAAIDTVISDNHIYRCGDLAGIWLDWMAQGTHVTGNLLHDNHGSGGDLFLEVNHGPFLVANNILLSPLTLRSQSQGGAFAHNLIAGRFVMIAYDARTTPYHKPHSTTIAKLHDNPCGDFRYYNNLFVQGGDISPFNQAILPVWMEGNVFLQGTKPCQQEAAPLLKPDFDPGVKLVEKPDGWYLEIALDTAWRTEAKRQLVTTALLGKAKIPDLPFENADGSPICIDTDYLDQERDSGNPFSGPFEVVKKGRQIIKVWPKPKI